MILDMAISTFRPSRPRFSSARSPAVDYRMLGSLALSLSLSLLFSFSFNTACVSRLSCTRQAFRCRRASTGFLHDVVLRRVSLYAACFTNIGHLIDHRPFRIDRQDRADSPESVFRWAGVRCACVRKVPSFPKDCPVCRNNSKGGGGWRRWLRRLRDRARAAR